MNPIVSSRSSNLVYWRGAWLGAPTGAGSKSLAAMPCSGNDVRARTQGAKRKSWINATARFFMTTSAFRVPGLPRGSAGVKLHR